MISTQQITSIDGDELLEWVRTALAPHLPANTHVSIIPHSFEAKGESRFFSVIDVEPILTIQDLLARSVSEHNRSLYVNFYASDVVAAACHAGELSGDYFWLYHTW